MKKTEFRFEERKWASSTSWIDKCKPSDEAPYLRSTCMLASAPKKAVAYVAAPGWHELYVNGVLASDRVLSPVVTQFTKRVSYVEYDLTKLLKKGKNAVVVLLGNGWYDCATKEVWGFANAPWRRMPKMRFELVVDGKLTLQSNSTWKTHPSPIVFNELRNGETYDARAEIADFASADYDDSDWSDVNGYSYPPFGELSAEIATPCRASESYAPVSSVTLADGAVVYDFGRNIAGWCEIDIKGKAGAKVELLHAECATKDGDVDLSGIKGLVKDARFQCDEYILAGKPDGERWHPSFTYHGFRYVKARFTGNLKLRNINARFVHTDFRAAGEIKIPDATFAKLQELTQRSFLSNFVGIPTDCPHREKNGWTGDVLLAVETGLWNYDARESYLHFMRLLADTQLPSGAVSCIAPTAMSFGYEWGSGPAWDSVLFEIPWQLYRFYADDRAIRAFYPVLTKYIEFLDSFAEGSFFPFGLGDWCPVDQNRMCPTLLTNGCFYYRDTIRLAFFADLLGRKSDTAKYERKARAIAKDFRKRWYRGKGEWAGGEWTALASAVYFGLCDDKVARLTVDALVEKVRTAEHKVDFGIIGAKAVPRVLADFGYADDAFRLFVQPEFPGWGHWVKAGASSLWETWNGTSSQNHIMFGDISAWAYEFLGGIMPVIDCPGFKHIVLAPCFITAIDRFEARHKAPQGEIKVAWMRDKKGTVTYNISLPDGVLADVVLQCGTYKNVSGKQSYIL